MKTCFVVMGFGKKTDFETGRVLDLDKSYRNMIKPAVEAAGLSCIRADEIVHSGVIDVPMYDQLLNADVVVADLSTSNKNAIYELGVRHALRPYTTIIICEDGFKVFPFDINHITIRQYHHLGEDIGFDEVMRFREQLTKAVKEIAEKNSPDKDSPVYTFLPALMPPEIEAISVAAVAAIALPQAPQPPAAPAQTHSALMQQVDDAQAKGDWITAKALLSTIRNMMKDEVKRKQAEATVEVIDQPEDPYLLQRLALVTYKSKFPTEKEALTEAHHLLNLMKPETSNDTETLGLWGSVHKRLWEITKQLDYLNEAIRAYKRGFYLRNDYYNGINYAFLLNARAAQLTDHAEAITDFINARRTRIEVVAICEEWFEKNPMPDEHQVTPAVLNDYLKTWYWVKASQAEAFVGLNEDDKAQASLNAAYKNAHAQWMKDSTEEQIIKLKTLLEDSPLKFITQ